jgi:hypothetical protein
MTGYPGGYVVADFIPSPWSIATQASSMAHETSTCSVWESMFCGGH